MMFLGVIVGLIYEVIIEGIVVIVGGIFAAVHAIWGKRVR